MRKVLAGKQSLGLWIRPPVAREKRAAGSRRGPSFTNNREPKIRLGKKPKKGVQNFARAPKIWPFYELFQLWNME
jgi:hypothetical protein